jgi:hypothetical protein
MQTWNGLNVVYKNDPIEGLDDKALECARGHWQWPWKVPGYCPYSGLPWIREMATNGYVDQEPKLRVTLWMMLILQYWKSTSLCVRMTMK